MVQSFYRRSSREIRRLGSLARSPVYAGFSEALDGAATIRGFQAAFPTWLAPAAPHGVSCVVLFRGSSRSRLLNSFPFLDDRKPPLPHGTT